MIKLYALVWEKKKENTNEGAEVERGCRMKNEEMSESWTFYAKFHCFTSRRIKSSKGKIELMRTTYLRCFDAYFCILQFYHNMLYLEILLVLL